MMTKVKVGARVRIGSTINYEFPNGTGGVERCTVHKGTRGTVTDQDGPTSFKVEWDNGVVVWDDESFLRSEVIGPLELLAEVADEI